MRKLLAYLRDERGVETLEWIVVGGALAVTAAAVYGGTLTGGLSSAITAILSLIPGSGGS